MPQIFADVDKEKALKQGVPIADVYAALQAFLGGSYVNDFTRFVAAVEGLRRRPSPAYRHAAPTT